MDLQITAFGISRDIVGQRQLILPISSPLRVEELRSMLLQKYPALSQLRSLAIAVNEEYVAEDHLINPTDEVVLLPPVSGG
jgi:molybdopterin synthase sulfur carrier subunit